MAKKVPDAQCLQNYEEVCAIFRDVVPDSSRFAVVYGCGVDVGLMDYIVLRTATYSYSSYAIGYDKIANEIVILPVNRDLSKYGKPYYLKNIDIDKAKISWMSKEIRVQSRDLPKKFITFTVQELLNEDPDELCICVKQEEQARDFHAFFKERYSK